MADDERRAEIEAVAEAIHAAEAEHSWLVGAGRIGAWRFASDDLKDLRRRQARAAVDRVRDARGDDEDRVALNQTRCSGCTEVVRDEEPLRFRSGVLWHEACLSRSPHSEDHEAGVWRVGRKVGRTIYVQTGPEPTDDDDLIGVMDTPALAAVVADAVNALSRVSPSRDGTVAVEDVRAQTIAEIVAFLRSAGDTRCWNESFKAAAHVIERQFGGTP